MLEEVYDLLVTETDLHEVCDAAIAGSDVEQIAATWLQKRSLEQGASWQSDRRAQWFSGLKELRPWEARLHALQCLPFLEPPAGARADLENFARDSLKSDVKFVRAWGLTGMHALAKRFERYRPEVEALLEKARETGPASFRARARQLLAKGF